MILYELIVPSASRPHLLGPMLTSLLQHVDQRPERVWVHDDAAFPGRQTEVARVVASVCGSQGIPYVVDCDDPPVLHGPALHKLLANVGSTYVLYCQDDSLTIRPLPVSLALQVMEVNQLHHVRFNKRATMEWKGTWQKKEYVFPATHFQRSHNPVGDETVTLTVADHWYFQLSLWRVARIKPVVDWWMNWGKDGFGEHCEMKINHSMNRGVPEFTAAAMACGYELPEQLCYAMDQETRARVQRTFIWGPIGEPEFFHNLATHPDDWALPRPRGGGGPPRVDTQARESE